ncbi:MAG TPA: PEP-CTERM sorting domain-containing protein [Fimbriimonadaceae bacterium]|nr:PEP-CTERM sorting domain-containing protein [Fimbriimonadaceae bacterium]
MSYTTTVGGMVDDNFQEVTYIDDPNLQTLAINDPTGSALAQAQIAPGVARVSSSYSSLDSANPAFSLMSDALTYWTDTVTIDDPLLNGTLGHFTANLLVSGTASYGLSGGYASGDPFSDAYIYGFWNSWIGTSTDNGDSFLVGGWFGEWTSDPDGNVFYSGDDLSQPLTEVTLDFIYGQPFLLRMNMEAYTDASNFNVLAGTASGTLDFSHTAYWNGISGFFDASGNPTNPNFSSGSGMDWRNSAVPEPSVLLALGTGLLFMRKRRARR